MLFIKNTNSIKINGKIRKQALFECTSCGVTKISRSDMKHSTNFCKKCSKTTHGMEGTKVYNLWLNIKARCYNKNNNRYSSYGGRGIKVCEEWHDAKVFIEWAINNGFEAKEGTRNITHTIERKNVNKDYCPGNCVFLPLKDQHYNKQRLSTSNTSGYIGVSNREKRSVASITYKGKRLFNKSAKTAEQAALFRELFILENNLPSVRNFSNLSLEEVIKNLKEKTGQTCTK